MVNFHVFKIDNSSGRTVHRQYLDVFRIMFRKSCCCRHTTGNSVILYCESCSGNRNHVACCRHSTGNSVILYCESCPGNHSVVVILQVIVSSCLYCGSRYCDHRDVCFLSLWFSSTTLRMWSNEPCVWSDLASVWLTTHTWSTLASTQ